ncbi:MULTISPECIES: hypothetical protein [Bacillota]|uniref:hypothetical protein n=1 Tax=Bacillota TaxID=1239 RepID=UPI0039F0672A
MKKKSRFVVPLLIGALILSGCSGGKFAEEAKKNEERNAELKDYQKKKEAEEEKVQKEFYENHKKPLNEVIQENDLDSEQIVDTIEFEPQDSYQDGDLFSKHVSKILFEFYTLKITAEEYYNFLSAYGSEEVLKELPTKEDAITILSTLQDMYKKQNISGDSYTLTTVTYDRLKREGRFYRKVLTTNGEEYFVTTIVKENDVWKFSEDSPSPPFIDSSNGSQFQTTDKNDN